MNAPKITLADIEAAVASEYYFTAADGVDGSLRVPSGGGADFEDRDALRLLTFCVLVLKNGFTVTGESACASAENFDAEQGRQVARKHAIAQVWQLMGYELRSKLSAADYEKGGPLSDAEAQARPASDFAAEKLVRAPRGASSEPADSIYAPRHAPCAAERVKEGYAARIGMRAPEPPKWLEPWQERVIAESRELEDRLAKLRSFLNSAAVAALTGSDQERLHRQATIMDQYAKVLAERIAAFK